jgi:hypothetical protein
MNNTTIEIRDIKPLLKIPDTTLYLYWGIIIGGIVILLALLFLALKWWRNRKENPRKTYLKALQAIKWDNENGGAKQAAYEATHYGRLLVDDARSQEIYAQLLPLLEKYKYKKEVGKVDDETLKQFNLFIQVCHESI